MANPDTVKTSGNYISESESEKALDEALERSQYFAIFREVEGVYIQPRPFTEDEGARIDRLLIPRPQLIKAGWHLGAIGIEIKKSGHKIGKIISQCLDYSRCVWQIPGRGNLSGLCVFAKWVFVFPLNLHEGCESTANMGDIISIMSQNRIGRIVIYKDEISFIDASTGVIRISSDKTVIVKQPLSGNKRGSR
jgi:hypothetical protein